MSRNKAKHAAYNKAYKKKNLRRIVAQNASYRAKNPEKWYELDKQKCLTAKTEAMDHYGGQQCSICPENRIGTLTIDHINGNGAEHRRMSGCSSGKKFYCWLKRNNYPTGFRILCANCNWREKIRVVRLRQQQTKYAIRQRRMKRNIKIKVMSRLGGSCIICSINDMDVLTVHHTNNNGAEHRRAICDGVSGLAFYYKIIKLDQFDGLECRCFSCNCNEEWG